MRHSPPPLAGLPASQERERVTAGKARDGLLCGSFYQEMVCEPPCDPTLAVSGLVCFKIISPSLPTGLDPLSENPKINLLFIHSYEAEILLETVILTVVCMHTAQATGQPQPVVPCSSYQNVFFTRICPHVAPGRTSLGFVCLFV